MSDRMSLSKVKQMRTKMPDFTLIAIFVLCVGSVAVLAAGFYLLHSHQSKTSLIEQQKATIQQLQSELDLNRQSLFEERQAHVALLTTVDKLETSYKDRLLDKDRQIQMLSTNETIASAQVDSLRQRVNQANTSDYSNIAHILTAIPHFVLVDRDNRPVPCKRKAIRVQIRQELAEIFRAANASE